MASPNTKASSSAVDPRTQTRYLIVDTESVPDGQLLSQVKYPGLGLTPDQAIDRAQAEAREASATGSDFLPCTFQIPVAICVVRVAGDFSLQAISCVDSPLFRPVEVVRKFWHGLTFYSKYRIVTFNGRQFDLPLLELAAFRHGIPAADYFARGRNRYQGDLDLMDWLGNYGASRMPGGLDLLAKLLGKPGKTSVSGDKVLEMYRARKLQEINDYCVCDTLDTYFVFLRTRVLTGDITPEEERAIVDKARAKLLSTAREMPILRRYIDQWQPPMT